MTKVSPWFYSFVFLTAVASVTLWYLADGSSVAPQSTTATPVAPVITPPVAVAVASVVTIPAASAAPASAPHIPRLIDTAVPASFHPQVASVVEAQKTGKFPERLSMSVAPKPFDSAAFAANPQAYLNVTEPGRVFQTAAAGPDAVPLMATVDHIINVPALGATPLSVTGIPGAPVSFTILDGGMFDNHLSSTTILSDDKGTATVTYTATPGTIDDVQILVGSPLTVGTLTLVVHVGEPLGPISHSSSVSTNLNN